MRLACPFRFDSFRSVSTFQNTFTTGAHDRGLDATRHATVVREGSDVYGNNQIYNVLVNARGLPLRYPRKTENEFTKRLQGLHTLYLHFYVAIQRREEVLLPYSEEIACRHGHRSTRLRTHTRQCESDE